MTHKPQTPDLTITLEAITSLCLAREKSHRQNAGSSGAAQWLHFAKECRESRLTAYLRDWSKLA